MLPLLSQHGHHTPAEADGVAALVSILVPFYYGSLFLPATRFLHAPTAPLPPSLFMHNKFTGKEGGGGGRGGVFENWLLNSLTGQLSREVWDFL